VGARVGTGVEAEEEVGVKAGVGPGVGPGVDTGVETGVEMGCLKCHDVMASRIQINPKCRPYACERAGTLQCNGTHQCT